MTKQSTVTEDWDSKLKLELTADNLKDWMFEYFDSQKAALNEIKKKMIDDGVPPDLAARCTYYDESPQEYVAKQKLKLWTNKKSGKLWDISTLEANGMLSSAEIDGIKSTHSGMLPPYYTIGGLQRIIDDRVKSHRDYLTYNWIFEGIRVGGNLEGQLKGEANYRINESGTRGYRIAPQTNIEIVQGENGDIRVTTFNQDATRLSDNVGNRIFDIPFSKEVVQALMKYTNDGQVSLGITQVSTGKHYSVKSMEEFTSEDPIALIKSFESPKPSIDSKSLIDELERRAREKAEKEIEHHEQYQ